MYGFLRETKKSKETTDLKTYLSVIFPEVDDWVFNKTTGLLKADGKKSLRRPDARSEQLKLIIEVDGLPHYQNPDVIIKDNEGNQFYEKHGYKVVRIPYFIQLSNKVVERLFGVIVDEPLFPENIPSFDVTLRNTPGYLCPLGIERLKSELKNHPDQWETNINYLKTLDEKLSGLNYM